MTLGRSVVPEDVAEIDRMVASTAERQLGVFTCAQTQAIGVTSADREYRLRTGRWREVHLRVYAIAGTPLTWKGDLLAAVWAGGPRGRASHRSAAALWGVAGGRTDLVEITCPRWRRARHENLVIHETKAFEAVDTTMISGVPVTSCERTLLDLGAVVSPLVVEAALDDALRKQHVTIESVRLMLRRTGRQGRDGAGVLREILLHRASGRPAESVPERAMVRMLRRYGFPDPVLQYEIYGDDGAFVARVDAAYPQWKVALEYESYEHHTGGLALVRDTKRRNRISAARWNPIGVTAPDLRPGGGREVAEGVKAARDQVLASVSGDYYWTATPKPW